MELLYIVLLGAIVWQVVLFILLSIPTPRGWKSSIAQMLSRNRTTQIFLLAHLSLCLIAGLLFADCYRMENKYRAERDFLIQNKNVGTGSMIDWLRHSHLGAIVQNAAGPTEQVHIVHDDLRNSVPEHLHNTAPLPLQQERIFWSKKDIGGQSKISGIGRYGGLSGTGRKEKWMKLICGCKKCLCSNVHQIFRTLGEVAKGIEPNYYSPLWKLWDVASLKPSRLSECLFCASKTSNPLTIVKSKWRRGATTITDRPRSLGLYRNSICFIINPNGFNNIWGTASQANCNGDWTALLRYSHGLSS